MKINFLKELRSHVKKALDDDEVKKIAQANYLEIQILQEK